MREPDHNDEGDWDPMLLYVFFAMCLSPFVWMVAKVLIFGKGN